MFRYPFQLSWLGLFLFDDTTIANDTHAVEIGNGTAEVDGEEVQKGAGFLVFVRRVVPMQVLIRLSFPGWLIVPEVRALVVRTMTDGIRLPGGSFLLCIRLQ